jgi:hypothetical protein
MKSLAIMLGSLIASAVSAAPTDGAVRTVNSSSGQFVVRGPALAQLSTNSGFADSTLIELDPNILAVTCERIKQALLRELTLADLWRGRVYVQINSALSTNQAPLVFAKPYLNGWQYQVELARSIEKPKLVSGLVQVLLMEIANRSAGLRSAEIPLWLSEGVAQALVHESEMDLVVPHPQRNFNLVNLSWQARQAARRDPLGEARGRLQTHASLSFTRLGDGLPNSAPEETWKTFQASAQLFVSELLWLPGGRSRLVEMLYELPFYLNWQSAFLNAFRGLFPRLLDVEKWWAVTITHFTGQDPTQAWAMPVALQKLDEALHPPVLISASRKDMPQRSRMSVQRIIKEWDYLRQRIVLKGVTAQLFSVRLKSPPELVALVEEYRAAIENYLAKRDQSGMARSLPGLPPLRADFLVAEIVKKLDELDAKRAAVSVTNAPPVSPSDKPAK